MPQPPLEQRDDVLARAVPAAHARAREPRRRAPPPAGPRRTLRGVVRGVWRRLDRSTARALGQEGHRVPDRRALRCDLAQRGALRRAGHVRRAARLGRLAGSTRSPAACCARSAGAGRRARPHAAVRARAGTLHAYRDDGPLALALGRLRRARMPASALVLAGAPRCCSRSLSIAGDGRILGRWPARRSRLCRAAPAACRRAAAARPPALGRPPALRAPRRRDPLGRRARRRLGRAGRVRAAGRSRSATTTSSTGCASAASTPPRWLTARRAAGTAGCSRFALAAAARVPAGLPRRRRRARGRVRRRVLVSWATFARRQQPDGRGRGGGGGVIGMVLAAGAGRRLPP